ncbi:hypothetical protein PFWH6_2687 [Pseudomonas fluorescens WH6]|nr:hypothetical protein PFWH6_2687 [Pseudomonas fluorescens WH6]
MCSCRQCSTKHTRYLPGYRRAKACRVADFAIGLNKVSSNFCCRLS